MIITRDPFNMRSRLELVTNRCIGEDDRIVERRRGNRADMMMMVVVREGGPGREKARCRVIGFGEHRREEDIERVSPHSRLSCSLALSRRRYSHPPGYIFVDSLAPPK